MAIRNINWDTCRGKLTRTYRNLNNGLMSIQQKIGNSWLIVGHSENLVLKDVTFFVSESGRQRVLREGQKNVHAWASGILLEQNLPKLPPIEPIFYCPYQQSYFSWKNSGKRLDRADYLVIDNNQIYCSIELTQSQLNLF